MRLDDFDFELPGELIATRPVSPRSAAKLLVAGDKGIRDLHVRDLVQILGAGDRLVVNNTKVIPARLIGARRRGAATAKIELTLIEPLGSGVWRALAKPLRKLKIGDALDFRGGVSVQVIERNETDVTIAFERARDVHEAIETAGDMPLPPYIAARRAADERDRQDYQTVFAKHRGAIAAPTASLHFDAPLLDALRQRGVTMTEVTLHVGAGTFLPVKTDNISEHRMHAEWGEVTEKAATEITATRAAGGRVICVGTTALRLIETAARSGEVVPFKGETDIFITPGFRFQVTDGLMTNFHLPKSTLMMLVSALMGRDRMMAIYAHAIAARYRFFSYGDASLLLPG
ncbi:MAG: tRNA preQ1(34) S-adenosylmethionine ribosyltransferase-isomerase QueA [Pseudomonadota bacterium]